jgi:8-hydroxy-5-deazaflavin:NADPH oxidoreductase
MHIGIIGAGHIGAALAKHFTQLQHTVAIANSRGPETLGDVAQQTGATPVQMSEAPNGAEILVVTIPLKNVPNLPKDLLKNLPASSIVIDTCNYYPSVRDGQIPEIDNGLPESVWVQQHIGRPVIKLFNNIYAPSLVQDGKPKGAPHRIALPVAGDDAAAKARLIELLDQMGFDGLDAGSLQDSWRQEPGTPAYCTDLDLAALPAALAAADHSKAKSKALEAVDKVFPIFGTASTRELVRVTRSMWPDLPQL